MRLDAYYYGFDSTGNDAIDLVLSAVACAGKAFHNTDCWMDEADPSRYNERLRGETMVEGIQNAANDAAKLLADRDAEIERLRDLNTSRLEDVAMLLKAFDDGLFVRNVACDDDPRWAIKLLTPLAAMGRLQRAIDGMEEARDGV